MKKYIIPSMLAVCYFTQLGESIKCWECNSRYDVRCADPFNNYTIGLVDCDQRQDTVQHLPNLDDELSGDATDSNLIGKATLCRKTVQTVKGKTRVIRGCGWVKNDGALKDRTCFNRAGTKDIQMIHCICKSDYCNHANTLKASDRFAFQLLATLASILPIVLLQQS